MNNLRTSIKLNKKLMVFVISLFLIGIILGIGYYFLQSKGIKLVITNELSNISEIINNSKNNILYHFIILTIIFILGFIVIGTPLILFYLFYEAMSLGFLITIFTVNYEFKGLIFSLLFIIMYKFIYLLILTYISLNSLKTSKLILKSFLMKTNDTIYNLIKNNTLKYLTIIIISLINDIFIYFIGSKILNFLF